MKSALPDDSKQKPCKISDMFKTTRTPRRTRSRAAGTLALDWVHADTQGASLLATAQNLLDAEREARQVLPTGIARVCRVARIDGHRMTLAVPSAAYASKLRQLTPRVVAQLNQAGRNVNEITVRVQGALIRNDTPPPARDIEPLDTQALDAFGQLGGTLPPGPLRDAIQRLLKRHR